MLYLSNARACAVGALLFSVGLSAACFSTTFRSSDELVAACIEADADTLAVLVNFNECVSSSCDTVESAQCTLTLEGNVISVSGEAEIKTTTGSGPNASCTSDCGAVEAVCTMQLPPGDYVLRGAGEDVAFTHPVTEQTGDCVY